MNIDPLSLLLVAVLMLIALVMLVSFRKHYKIRVFWALLSIVLSGFAMLLCLVGTSAGTVYARLEGDPQATVQEFFSSIVSEDYEHAYSLMKNHADLGLGNEPSSKSAQLISQALKASYDYKLVDSCEIELLSAKQRVSMRYLDISKATSGLEEATEAKLKTIVQERSHNAVYDEDDNYLPAVTEEAYLSALTDALKNAKSCYTQVEFDVQLEYTDGSWLLLTAPELLTALSGGTGL